MITFSCQKCGKQYNLKSDFAGRKTTCSGCKEPLVVPELESPRTVAPEAKSRIAFSCTRCGMKFNALAEFAGRKTACPSCKETLIVPSPEQTVAYVPPAGQIDGMASVLTQAQVDAGISLGGGPRSAGTSALQDLTDGKSGNGARYFIDKEIARGGMGAVLRAVDCDIRREVALKYLLDQSNATNKTRFVEEAQITGQLEHPNIVPIHELGIDLQKRIYFTMKLVQGRSVAQILQLLRDKSAAGAKEYTLSRLLNIFVNVCNALAYAHARGVVHRDLKPANIMVGDFGEVYVMDWGLAKVLDKGTSMDKSPPMALPVATMAVKQTGRAVPEAAPVETPSGSTSGSGKVTTSREADADLTQAGAVLGTPVYMPPEQAAGKIDLIDERSDIYSMGAILYEMLTLQPPIDKTGGFWPIILRVSEGKIEPPEKKAPQRARAGKIPVELAAIAMKALAKEKADRYQTIESLRKDIELFQEGRSVSAKQDTIREMAVKLVKRNKGVSIATAAAAVVLSVVVLWSLIAIFRANSRALAEEVAKREQARDAVPSFVRAAKLLINEKQFEDAYAQVNAVVNFDPDNAEARFVRAQLLLLRQDFESARTDLDVCLQKQPDRGDAKKLLELARGARKDDKATLLALAEEFGRQKASALAEQTTRNAEKLMASKNEMLQLYQVRIETAWPGQGKSLTLDGDGKYQISFGQGVHVDSLEPLRGIPLSSFSLVEGAKITDLGPLKGMPLVSFHLHDAPVADLTPLQGAPLENLQFHGCTNITDLRPLKGMRLKSFVHRCPGVGKLSDLSPLEDMPLTYLEIYGCPNASDWSVLKGMPLTSLQLVGCQVKDLSLLKGMPLTALALSAPGVSDLSPLAGMKLTYLEIQGASLSDLSPLKGMPITRLNVYRCENIGDLSPLTGMPLANLVLSPCKVSDLSPLKGMKLTSLTVSSPVLKNLDPLKGMPLTNLDLIFCENISDLSALQSMKLTTLLLRHTRVEDLEPLRGMPLTYLQLNATRVANLGPLAGAKLGSLQIDHCPVRDLSPLKEMPLGELRMEECKEVHDLTPLAGMNLGQIVLPPNVTKGIEVIRAMKTLTSIDGTPTTQFWKLWDAAKAKAK